MQIGVPREIKTEEFRVGITPFGVQELTRDGQAVLIEKDAGAGSGFSDEEYARAGAVIVDREQLFKKSRIDHQSKGAAPAGV